MKLVFSILARCHWVTIKNKVIHYNAVLKDVWNTAMNSYSIKYDSAKTLVQESFFPLWRNFEGLLFFNKFHKQVEVTVSIFESALGNGRKCLAREKSFVSSGAP